MTFTFVEGQKYRMILSWDIAFCAEVQVYLAVRSWARRNYIDKTIQSPCMRMNHKRFCAWWPATALSICLSACLFYVVCLLESLSIPVISLSLSLTLSLSLSLSDCVFLVSPFFAVLENWGRKNPFVLNGPTYTQAWMPKEPPTFTRPSALGCCALFSGADISIWKISLCPSLSTLRIFLSLQISVHDLCRMGQYFSQPNASHHFLTFKHL